MDALCRGSWSLGSACGRCQRCKDTAQEAVTIIRSLMAEKPFKLQGSELAALVEFNRSEVHRLLEERKFRAAREHLERCEELMARLRNTDPPEIPEFMRRKELPETQLNDTIWEATITFEQVPFIAMSDNSRDFSTELLTGEDVYVTTSGQDFKIGKVSKVDWRRQT